MHRAISGDLQNEEEMDRAMEDSGDEGIYQVSTHAAWTDIRQNVVYSCSCQHMCLHFQRTHGLFGDRVDSFSTETANAQSQQMTHQRPLKFSDSQPESPPSSGLLPTTEFFPTTAPKSNLNNNAFAEWVPNTRLSIKETG